MEALGGLLIGAQFVFIIIAGTYFYTSLKQQKTPKKTVHLDSKKETEKLQKLRGIKLSEPLSEKTRPQHMHEIVGQEKGLRALRAAICGPNPQHVIIYGPPGVGKTAAARILLNEARQSERSPFAADAPFIEMDATILQFDERSIADPLIGSVHDPIYQGAGAYGNAGIPTPKAGAVTRAHGGVLFLDEIGELHPIQMNKLLKVLEDRKVYLTSSYYAEENMDIPKHIHDIFTNGLPADFRLIGATTRRPEELPPALRSRCAEVFFRRLHHDEVVTIAQNALAKTALTWEDGVPDLIAHYSTNGRDTVNIVQTAASLALLEKRSHITLADTEEVIEYGRYTPKPEHKISENGKVGVANGLAVYGLDSGALLEIEAVAQHRIDGLPGTLKVTGIVEQEEINNGHTKMKRTSTAKGSVENVVTVLNKIMCIPTGLYDIHVNFPGGAPVDGPSAGIAIFSAVYSAITGQEIPQTTAMTGEITLKGRVHAVGGVAAKIEAALEAGATKVLIPKANNQKAFEQYGSRIVTVEALSDVLREVFHETLSHQDNPFYTTEPHQEIMTAAGDNPNITASQSLKS